MQHRSVVFRRLRDLWVPPPVRRLNCSLPPQMPHRANQLLTMPTTCDSPPPISARPAAPRLGLERSVHSLSDYFDCRCCVVTLVSRDAGAGEPRLCAPLRVAANRLDQRQSNYR